MTDPNHSARGVACLLLATFIWGSTFVVTQKALGGFPASELVLGRFLVAGVVFLPFLRRGKLLWIASIELGIWLWAGFALQTIGLRYTTVNRSAFITSMAVIFVPMLTRLSGKSTRVLVWVAAVVALGGAFLLSHDGSPPNAGDLWTLCCAMVWAVYISRLEKFAAVLPGLELTAACFWPVVILSLGWTAVTGFSRGAIPWFAILYLGIFATAVTTLLQTLGQKWVSAPQAAVLYTLEPVWASVFAWVVIGDVLGTAGKIGAVMILGAAVVTQVPVKVWGVSKVEQ